MPPPLPLGIVRLGRGASIMQQLRLEEALLRSTTRSWFVVSWDPRAEEDASADAAAADVPPPLAAASSIDADDEDDHHPSAAVPRPPTIVLGISGKPAELIDLDLCVRQGAPGHQRVVPAAIRRFSGGGTVVVGRGTVLASLVVSREDLARRGIDPFPGPLMRWSAGVYARAFEGRSSGSSSSSGAEGGASGGGAGAAGAAGRQQHQQQQRRQQTAPPFPHHHHPPPPPPRLVLNENDYCFGDLKVAGNAQAITGGRALHHTSFLWDWNPKHMRLLLPPKRQPDYRRARHHGAFLSRVRDAFPLAFPRPADLARALEGAAREEWGGQVEDARPEDLALAMRGRHLRGNRWVDLRREAEAALAASASAATDEREARGGERAASL